MLWRIESMGRFYDANEGSVVYYDPSSGDTHLLNDFAAFVVQQFSTQPLALDELVAGLSDHVEAEDIPALAQTVSSVLEELTALDILQRV